MLIGLILIILTDNVKNAPCIAISLNKSNLIQIKWIWLKWIPSSYFTLKKIAIEVLRTSSDQTSVLPIAKFCLVFNK